MKRKLFPALVALLLTSQLAINDNAATPHWTPAIHQAVIVKASSLMPEALQSQILRHQREILRGGMDALRNDIGPGIRTENLSAEIARLKKQIQSKTPFADICYSFGRVSAFCSEYSSVLGSTDPAYGDHFGQLVDREWRNFPLVIKHTGEGPLRSRSLDGYLALVAERNGKRQADIVSAMNRLSSYQDMFRQRSAVYGLAILSYNDLVLDTARIWLHIWEEAGGDITDAPYFTFTTDEGSDEDNYR